MQEVFIFLMTLFLVYINEKLIVSSETRRINANRIFISVNIPAFAIFVFSPSTYMLLISAFFYSLYFTFYLIIIKISLFNNWGKDSPQAKLGFVVTNLMVSILFAAMLVYYLS